MVGYSQFTTPVGNVVPRIIGERFAGEFSNTATFDGKCADGEYRQYVKGEFSAKGSKVDHRLCGAVLLEKDKFHEDGCPPGHAPGVRAYGYRSRAGDAYDKYSPSQADGCSYTMFDAPGFNKVEKGVKYKIELTFRATLIDTADNNKVLVMKEWTVIGELDNTNLADDHMMDKQHQKVPIAEDDYILSAFQTINEDTRKPEIHVIVARKPGLLPLDPASIHVEVTAKDDVPLPTETPVVYEVGDLRSATATVVIPLPKEAIATKVRISSKANAVLLAVGHR
jgi:hypothetical protein